MQELVSLEAKKKTGCVPSDNFDLGICYSYITG